MRRIGKRVREEAIEACLCRADEWSVAFDPTTIGRAPNGLAWDAWCAASDHLALRGFEHQIRPVEWLEAAALLRGDDEHKPWSPGDETYLLPAARREES